MKFVLIIGKLLEKQKEAELDTIFDLIGLSEKYMKVIDLLISMTWDHSTKRSKTFENIAHCSQISYISKINQKTNYTWFFYNKRYI